MSPKQVVRHFGSQTKAAKALGVTRAAVNNWLRRGRVPFPTQCTIKHFTNGALKVTNA